MDRSDDVKERAARPTARGKQTKSYIAKTSDWIAPSSGPAGLLMMREGLKAGSMSHDPK
jgi:hypothetical protein